MQFCGMGDESQIITNKKVSGRLEIPYMGVLLYEMKKLNQS